MTYKWTLDTFGRGGIDTEGLISKTVLAQREYEEAKDVFSGPSLIQLRKVEKAFESSRE